MHEKNSSKESSDSLPSLAALSAFEAAARHGSFAQAAAQLGRTPSAVSHAIRDMEDRFGETLFERSGRSVTLTRPGEDYLKAVDSALLILRTATRQLTRHREDHVIRVSALPFFTSAVLLPNLSLFEQDNPKYDLRIETSSSYADILNGEADIAIRFGDDQSEGLVCTPLIEIAGQPIASPTYLRTAAKLEEVRDLRNHTLIHVRPNENAWQDWSAQNGYAGLEGHRELTFDTLLGALDAVKAGRGIALAMDPLIRGYPGFGTDFVPVLAPPRERAARYNFVCRRSNFDDQKVQKTLKWLKTALSRSEHRAKS